MPYSFNPGRLNIAGMESFYKEKAAKGLHLKNIGVFFSSYEKGTPADVDYRLHPWTAKGIFNAEISDETKRSYTDSGWEYVCSTGQMAAFRSAGGKATEVYTDADEYAKLLKLPVRDSIITLLSLPALAVVYIVLNSFIENNLSRKIYLAFISNTWAIAGLLAIILSFEIAEIIDAAKFLIYYSKLKKSIHISHDCRHTSPAAACVLLAAGIAGVGSYYLNAEQPMPVYSDGAYVTYRDMGTEADRGIFMGKESTVQYSSSPFGQYWDTYEYIDNGQWMYQEIMVHRYPEMVDATITAFMKASAFAQDEKAFSEITFPGLDRVLYTGSLECIVVKGSRVAFITGIFDNSAQLEMLLGTLAEKWT